MCYICGGMSSQFVMNPTEQVDVYVGPNTMPFKEMKIMHLMEDGIVLLDNFCRCNNNITVIMIPTRSPGTGAIACNNANQLVNHRRKHTRNK